MKKLKAYYLFGRTPLPSNLSAEMDKALQRLEKYDSREAYLKAAYEFITERYESGRLNTALKLFDLFSASLQDLWNRSGFMHCTNQNYLLVVLLVKSECFKESDIKLQWTTVSFLSPHQYLRVRVGAQRWVDVDCWGRHYGIGYGNHAHAFNATLFKSFVR